MAAIEAAGYKPGKDVTLAMDCASSEFYKDGVYDYTVYEGKNGAKRTSKEQAEYLASLVAKYPIMSIEDGMDQNDWEGWKLLTEKIGDRCQLVGDDLFVTNVERPGERHQGRCSQRPAGESKPDRFADRNDRRRRNGTPRRLHHRDVAPLRRIGGRYHRRPGRSPELRTDQDRIGFAFGPYGQVQPVAAHRGTTRRCCTVPLLQGFQGGLPVQGPLQPRKLPLKKLRRSKSFRLLSYSTPGADAPGVFYTRNGFPQKTPQAGKREAGHRWCPASRLPAWGVFAEQEILSFLDHLLGLGQSLHQPLGILPAGRRIRRLTSAAAADAPSQIANQVAGMPAVFANQVPRRSRRKSPPCGCFPCCRSPRKHDRPRCPIRRSNS